MLVHRGPNVPSEPTKERGQYLILSSLRIHTLMGDGYLYVSRKFTASSLARPARCLPSAIRPALAIPAW